VQLVLTHFGSWFERLPGPHARDAWLATLPRLRACFTSRAPLPWWGRIPFISRHGAIRQVQSDIEEILEAAASLPAADDCRRLLELLGSYGETTGDIVMGACRIGRAALRWKAPDLLDKLASIVAPKGWPAMSEVDRNLSSDLLRSWGELGATCEASGEESWKLAIPMVPPLAEENTSSAQWTAQQLPRVLQRLPREMTIPYLRCFRQLASAIGTRALGFALRRLPRLLAEHGVAAATSFVNVAAEVGQAYGPTAGQWFLERKTGAAKGML
jgi:hypothetical protein